MTPQKRWKLNNQDRVREQARKDTRNYRIKHRDRWKKLDREYKRRLIPIFRKRLLDLRVEKGGKCSLCGYCQEIRILHFHHLRDKRFELSRSFGKSIKKMREEAEKCILLCPNCHALTHLTPKQQE